MTPEENASKLMHKADDDHFYTTIGLTFPSSHQRAIESSQIAAEAFRKIGNVKLAAIYEKQAEFHKKKKAASERREAKRNAR